MSDDLTQLRPFCVVKGEQDRRHFASLHAFFATPLARRHDIVAVAQRYVVDQGLVTAKDQPLFLLRSAAERSAIAIETLDRRLVRAGDPVDEALLRRYASTIAKASFLHDEMVFISRRVWLVALPHLVVMQADQIAAELRGARILGPDLRRSTWARSAYATLRMAPPRSGHETIALLDAIRRAICLLREFRPDAFAEARDAGYELGSFDRSDLEAAIAAGGNAG